MLAISALQWPCSARYIMQTRFGYTEQTLSFDLIGLGTQPDKTPAVLWALWSLLVAPATVRSTQLAWIEWVAWKQTPLAMPYVGLFAEGRIFERTRSRDQQLVVVLHSGHPDDYAGRRFFLPGTPIGWSDGSMLTRTGFDNGMDMISAWAMGCMAYFCGGEVALLNAYPGVLPPELSNLAGVAFRRVSDLRLCQYVDKAPELSDQLWP